MSWCMGMSLGDRVKRQSQGDDQISGNVALSRNTDRASGSEETFPSFLGCKEDREWGTERYFQT